MGASEEPQPSRHIAFKALSQSEAESDPSRGSHPHHSLPEASQGHPRDRRAVSATPDDHEGPAPATALHTARTRRNANPRKKSAHPP